MNRDDLFVDLTFDNRKIGSMFRDDWELLLMEVDETWSVVRVKDFIVQQEIKSDARPGYIAANVLREVRNRAERERLLGR